ncbi:MAG: outer membrane beta-barrel protein, partial [Elusimicrobiaceae bacterium]|nr:outer membrane beta-barrel protein [Elusimicrobiaceae bacterium]
QLMPKTQLQAGYTFAQVKYKDNTRNNSNIHKVDGGLMGQVAPKVTGEIIAGVQFRDYSNNFNTASNKATTFSYGITLAWTPGVNSTLTLKGIRDNIESIYVNSRYYTSTLTDLEFEHKFGKLVGNMSIGYENARYPEITTGYTDKRSDDYLHVSADLDYNIQKWLKVGAGYMFRNRSSNENTYNYDDHQVACQIKATF